MAKQESDQAKSVKQQRRPSPCKPYLAFSIESILGRKEEDDEKAVTPTQVFHGKEAFTNTRREVEQEHKAPSEVVSTTIAHLPWLAYTRYSPPKLPSEYNSFVHLKLTSTCSCFMLGRTDEAKSDLFFIHV